MRTDCGISQAVSYSSEGVCLVSTCSSGYKPSKDQTYVKVSAQLMMILTARLLLLLTFCETNGVSLNPVSDTPDQHLALLYTTLTTPPISSHIVNIHTVNIRTYIIYSKHTYIMYSKHTYIIYSEHSSCIHNTGVLIYYKCSTDK